MRKNTFTHLHHSPPLSPPPSSAETGAHARPGWKNHMRLPAPLSPVPRRRDAHTQDAAAQKCAQLPEPGPGGSFASSTASTRLWAPWVRGEHGKLWHTLHVTGDETLRCLESCAGERLNRKHNNTETLTEPVVLVVVDGAGAGAGGGVGVGGVAGRGTWLPVIISTPAPLPLRLWEMITELVCTAVAVGLYLNTLDADFCYDDR